MNSFFRPTFLDWADALPAFPRVLPQDDIAANVCRALDRIPEPTTVVSSVSITGEPENPLHESPPSVSTQTPWAAETILPTRGSSVGMTCASEAQIAPNAFSARSAESFLSLPVKI